MMRWFSYNIMRESEWNSSVLFNHLLESMVFVVFTFFALIFVVCVFFYCISLHQLNKNFPFFPMLRCSTYSLVVFFLFLRIVFTKAQSISTCIHEKAVFLFICIALRNHPINNQMEKRYQTNRYNSSSSHLRHWLLSFNIALLWR